MKRVQSLLVLCIFFGVACEKPGRENDRTCFKGRYVGTGCWPVIELLEQPSNMHIPTARYGDIENAFGTGEIPEKYKDGRAFYFTVTQIDSDFIYMTYCSPTKYLVALDGFSYSACDKTAK